MVAPLMLLKPTYYELITSRGGENAKSSPAFLEALDEGEVGALSSAGLMLIPSFLLALGAFLYLKKRMF
jgi:hypothetical protein